MNFKHLSTENPGPRAVETLEPLLKFVEKRLETKGEWRRAQELRDFQLRWRGIPLSTAKIVETWIMMHFKLDLVVQRLSSLLAKEKKLQSQTETGLDQANAINELKSIQERIMAARKVVLRAQIELHQKFLKIPHGPLRRAIESLRRNDKDWFLSEWLRSFCIARGGCCARDCGCCEKARHGIDVRGIGHCTSACVCCEEDRGICVDNTDEDHSGPLFRWGPEGLTELEVDIFHSIATGL